MWPTRSELLDNSKLWHTIRELLLLTQDVAFLFLSGLTFHASFFFLAGNGLPYGLGFAVCCRPACGQLCFIVAVQGVLTFIVQGEMWVKRTVTSISMYKREKIHWNRLQNGFYTKCSCFSIMRTIWFFTVCQLWALPVNSTKQPD